MNNPFNLDAPHKCQWPINLRPIGEGSFEKEPFEDWWARNYRVLSHLPSELCEQWIYRHWTNSPFTFLPLETLEWRRLKLEGVALLSSIYRAWGGELSPEFDYNTFQRRGGDERHPTALALDQGTWDYPIVLLSTPNGIIDNDILKLDVHLVIVEGHQRHRYLNALHALGKPPEDPHEVLVISSPTMNPMD